MSKRPSVLPVTFVETMNVPGRCGGLGLSACPIVTLAMALERAVENAHAVAIECVRGRMTFQLARLGDAAGTVGPSPRQGYPVVHTSVAWTT